ncbi:MAG: hypothetical protein RLZZ450_2177 [Pseudomonadota bacterium]|jgi:hypothetical protein
MVLRIKKLFPLGLFVLALALGCGSDPAASGKGRAVGAADDDDSDEDEEPTPVKKDAGKASSKDAGKASTDAGVKAPDKEAPDAPVVSLKGDLPCDVRALVVSKCGACHGAKPAGGAPMSLVTLADFHRPAESDDTRTIDVVSLERMNEKDVKRRMPPASVDITAAETKTLTDWLSKGAKGSTAACTDTTEPEEGTTDAKPATGHSGGVSISPLTYDDPNLKCYKFLGFSKSGDRAKKYDVPTTPDYYVKFDLKPEFKGVQYLKSYKPVIDNSAVLHHWLFYKQNAAGNNAVQENAIGTHPEGELIAGWAPGGDPIYFDSDTGVELSGDVNYQMEMHYNNKTGGVAQDASGVEVCVTTTKPAHVAAMGWLGTDNLSGTQSTGNCKPTNTEPVHLIAATPHMHLKGRHMKVVITRKDGKQEVIHDKDFDFEYQRQYVLDYVVNPGDSVQTTCTFSEPARFGKGTNDEMCYFFTTHWPAGKLTMLGSGTIIHGGNSCLP